MPSAGQFGDATLIRTGAHRITVGTGGAAKIAGFTVGNLSLTFNKQSRLVYVAEYGQTPVDEQVLGIQMAIAFTMIERSLKILDIALNGLYPGVIVGGRGLGRAGIYTAQERGQQITLHPVKRLLSDTTEDVVLHKVLLSPTGSLELSDQDNQLCAVEGTCVIDTSKTDGRMLAEIYTPNAGV